jgi:pyruvate,water dikinase
MTYLLTGRKLSQLGTGNISVSAAFYHGGRLAGILAVLSEAFKGIAAVLLARAFFPSGSEWELIALIALVMGRYWMGKAAGTTNVVWGFTVHDWVSALFVLLIGGISFTIFRNRATGRLGVLILFPVVLAMLHPYESARIGAAIALAGILFWIYQKIPDDLTLEPERANMSSRSAFRFFRGDRAIVSLDRPLAAQKVGEKAATLSQLKRWGYPVPDGWVLEAGDDPQPLIEYLQPSQSTPLAVRSSVVGEDSEAASAAGQYASILNVKSRAALEQAIEICLASYDAPAAMQYRRDRSLSEGSMSILIQKQVQGAYSGVAFSRDPIAQQGDTVIVEALPGEASRIVSGKFTPEQYRVAIGEMGRWGDGEMGRWGDGEMGRKFLTPNSELRTQFWLLPEDRELEVEGTGEVPSRLIQQVAYLARQLESRYRGVPQDIEWSYDGERLWLLQSRPITTLLPIWTRKIAAEVIPGLIRPLTWSINRPLTCGVWGEIFTLVLGKRSHGLDFEQTAALHYSRAYFNASLLGDIFLRMGLPPESLEFLTRGAKFSKPPFSSTLVNLPGLMRLLGREFQLEKDFQQDDRRYFVPTLEQLAGQPLLELSPSALLERIDLILEVLKKATYYSILTPLSLAFRQAMLKVKETELDNSHTPEVESMRSLQQLADDARHLLSASQPTSDGSTLFAILAEIADGDRVIAQFDRWLQKYGYLSEVATDIAVPTWQEDRQPVRDLFAQFLTADVETFHGTSPRMSSPQTESHKWQVKVVQSRLNLKGRVTAVYSRLLAELRWSFVALEQGWLKSGLLSQSGDVFFLEFAEIRRLITDKDAGLRAIAPQLVKSRRAKLESDRQLTNIPYVFYGSEPPVTFWSLSERQSQTQLQGLGASPGLVEGKVKVLRHLKAIAEIDRQTILVVPYTDSGWSPWLARAGGLIAEVGGRLSHGAIVAREYGIPAVMDVHNATELLLDGQQVRIDGQRGIIEIF